MRIIFMGTPGFAVPTLEALVEAGHEVVAAYTQPPRPGGRRGKGLTKTPIHEAAEALAIEVRHPASLKGTDEAEFLALAADVAVVAAYGLSLPQALLDAPKHGCLNVHASLLPRWRGAAPIQRAILAGDEQTGVTIMRMEGGLDTGPMLLKARIPVNGKNAGELTAELAEIGAHLMVDALAGPTIPPGEPQDGARATYAAKIDKAETRLDFAGSAEQVTRHIRAFSPTPAAWFELEGERFKVLAADRLAASGAPGTVLDDQLTIACGEGAIRPSLVQRAGKPAMAVADMLRGRPIPAGTALR